METRIFYTVILGFASGIFLRSFFAIGLVEIVWLLLIALVCGVLAKRPSRGVLLMSVAVFMIALGVLRLELAEQERSKSMLVDLVGQPIELTGVVVREPDERERSKHLYVRHTESKELLLVIIDPFQSISYGDQLTVSGVLTKPEAFETDLGRTFNYPGYLQAQGVEYMVRYPESLTVIDVGQGTFLVGQLLTLKKSFQEQLRQYIRGSTVGLAEGLLLGEKRALGDEWNELFRRTGIIHIVVLSGFNVMLVVAFMLFVLSYVTTLRGRAIGGIVGIICFALIVGLSATVVRASIMASLTLLALALGRTYGIMRALLFAGVGMLLLNPYLLVYDPGFQLSFLATLGLIVIAPQFESLLTVSPRSIRFRDYIIATIATQIAVLPLLLYQIGELSLVAVLVNVLVLPMVPVAMALTFATGLLGYVFAPLAVAAGFLTHLSLQYILLIVGFIGSWPLAAVAVPPFPFWVVMVGYGLLGYWWYRISRSKSVKLLTVKPVDDITAEQNTSPVEEWTIVEVVQNKAGVVRRTTPAPRNIFMP